MVAFSGCRSTSVKRIVNESIVFYLFYYGYIKRSQKSFFVYYYTVLTCCLLFCVFAKKATQPSVWCFVDGVKCQVQKANSLCVMCHVSSSIIISRHTPTVDVVCMLVPFSVVLPSSSSCYYCSYILL